jgi:glycosyltransferase involved in cell wall biosynthesis
MSQLKLTQKQAKLLIADFSKEVVSPLIVADPLVSVCLQIHNHSEFIDEALENVLIQDINFPFEVVIGDDASTDGSSEIIDHYQREYPEKIKILRSTENLGKYTANGRLNFIRSLRACRGKYIAILDGDDYWTDPFKLQKQIEHLEKHPDCAGSCHDVIIVDNAGNKISLPGVFVNYGNKVDLNFKDIVSSKTPFHTSSFVFRREVIERLPIWFLNAPYGDRPLMYLAAERGQIRRIPEMLSAYRKHPGGLTQKSSGLAYTMNFLSFNYMLKRYFSPQGASEFNEMLRPREKSFIGCVSGGGRFTDYVTGTAFFMRHLRFSALGSLQLRLLRVGYTKGRNIVGRFIPSKIKDRLSR